MGVQGCWFFCLCFFIWGRDSSPKNVSRTPKDTKSQVVRLVLVPNKEVGKAFTATMWQGYVISFSHTVLKNQGRTEAC